MFSVVYEHALNGDLKLQPMASVDLVNWKPLEQDGLGVDVDGWMHDVHQLKGRRRGEISTVGKRNRPSSPQPSLPPSLCCLPGLDTPRQL